ncbi:MAG TPA: AraD1 family protein [Candidatus Acidoferrales bacterium]|nr:AraD1 family protein [Candidatus Acidoferrales bacterium]
MTKETTRLIQLREDAHRQVALVDEPDLRPLTGFNSVYQLALEAIRVGTKLSELVRRSVSDERLSYDPIYSGRSDWRILPPIDFSGEPSRCLISGTGLTHLGSAQNRQDMHALKEEELTDSMKMFRWGIEGGRPAAGHVGTPPEWFYKGSASILRAHGEPLVIPSFGEDGGEEAEIAGVYIVGPDAKPRRIGMACGNEFADHRFEKKNYLNLAGSKLRTCSLGPELVLDPSFNSVVGEVSIGRAGQVLWSKEIRTGEAEMCHSLANIEHHHFKYEAHRRAGDVHVHYFGADCLSYGEGIQLKDGDLMQVRFEGFGRPLVNPLQIADSSQSLTHVIALG